MISSNKGTVRIEGDAAQVLAEFHTMGVHIFRDVYKRVYGDLAKDKYFEHTAITTLSDDAMDKVLGKEEGV